MRGPYAAAMTIETEAALGFEGPDVYLEPTS